MSLKKFSHDRNMTLDEVDVWLVNQPRPRTQYIQTDLIIVEATGYLRN